MVLSASSRIDTRSCRAVAYPEQHCLLGLSAKTRMRKGTYNASHHITERWALQEHKLQEHKLQPKSSASASLHRSIFPHAIGVPSGFPLLCARESPTFTTTSMGRLLKTGADLVGFRRGASFEGRLLCGLSSSRAPPRISMPTTFRSTAVHWISGRYSNVWLRIIREAAMLKARLRFPAASLGALPTRSDKEAHASQDCARLTLLTIHPLIFGPTSVSL